MKCVEREVRPLFDGQHTTGAGVILLATHHHCSPGWGLVTSDSICFPCCKTTDCCFPPAIYSTETLHSTRYTSLI